MTTLDVGGVALTLLPQKAAFIPARSTLLVADAHIGKAVSFRTWGVPVPEDTTSETLTKLTDAIDSTGARLIVFLGDFLHSKRSHAVATLDAVQRWRERHADVAMTLVRGNHDARAGDPPAALRFTIVDEPMLMGGLALCHHPVARHGAYVLAGHLHPCVTLAGPARDFMRLPCFHFGRAVGVLPAFGSFTGMHPIIRTDTDRVYAVAHGEVVQV